MDNKFKSPKLLITDHYDEEIRQLDIYMKELLEKYNENDLLPGETENNINFDIYDDQIKTSTRNLSAEKFIKYDKNKLIRLDVTPGTTRVRDFINLVRSKSIDELKKAEQYNLDNYELKKDLYKYDRNSLTNEKVEEMRENLFKDKFAFVIRSEESKSLLKVHTIITDFYLDGKDLEIVKKLNLMNTIFYWDSLILDEKTLFLHLVCEYIIGLVSDYECYFGLVRVRKYDYDTEIISISKSSLSKINRVNIICLDCANLPATSSIDFSFIKYLNLKASDYFEPKFLIRDLSGLKQLERLQIEGMWLNADSFKGLEKLTKLELIQCMTLEDKLCFPSLKSLDILIISSLFSPIELKSLENLQILKIDGQFSFGDVIDLNESIRALQIDSQDCNISRVDELFSRVYLPNLVELNMSGFELPLKEQWFTRIPFLKELRLNYNLSIKNLDFCQFECFAQLEKLDLSQNRIEKLGEGVFSKLKALKSLSLSNNPIVELGSNGFLGLENLEYLFLDRIQRGTKRKRIEKDAFNGLSNLKKLYLENNRLNYIHPEAFIHTPNLNVLSLNHNRVKSIDTKIFSHTPKLIRIKICYNKMRLDKNTFSNLNHFNEIELSERDVEYINRDFLEIIKEKSNIKLSIVG